MRHGLLGMLIIMLLTGCALNKPENLETHVTTGWWYSMGGMLDTTAFASITESKIVTHNNVPFVAFTQCDSLPCLNGDVYVKQWNSLLNTWTQLGVALDNPIGEPAFLEDLVITNQGYPVIAFDQCYVSEALQCQEWGVVVKRWDSQSWVSLPELPVSHTFDASHVQLASSGNQFYVLYNPNPFAGEMFQLYRLDESWTMIGVFPSSESGFAGVHLSVNSIGFPLLSWTTSDKTLDLVAHISQYDGKLWNEFVTPLPGVRISTLHVDNSSHPIITAVDNVAADFIHVLRWNGNEWTQLGGNLLGIGWVRTLNYQDNPVIYGPGGLRYWNGSNWIVVSLARPRKIHDYTEASWIFIDRDMLLLVSSGCSVWPCQSHDTYIQGYTQTLANPGDSGPLPISP